MVDKLDWTVLPKEKDPPEETEVDSVDQDSEVDSEVIETTPETKEILLSFLVKMTRTPRKEPLELSLERKLLSDHSFKNFIFTIHLFFSYFFFNT